MPPVDTGKGYSKDTFHGAKSSANSRNMSDNTIMFFDWFIF